VVLHPNTHESLGVNKKTKKTKKQIESGFQYDSHQILTKVLTCMYLFTWSKQNQQYSNGMQELPCGMLWVRDK
jgi:hypothetical protein